MNSYPGPRLGAALLVFLAATLATSPASAHAINGAIYTSTFDHTEVNANQYATKDAVYLNGGPSNSGCKGGSLDDGIYHFQVTNPSGSVLLSTGSTIWERTMEVSGGVISSNLGNQAKHPNGNVSPCGSLAIRLFPFDDTPNTGGVYKVWITRADDFEAACGVGVDCGLAGFVPGHTKTDNFRVGEEPTIPQVGSLEAFKFYDANANGIFDGTDVELEGWVMTLTSVNQGVDSTQATEADGTTTWTPLIPDNDYYVTEGTPVEGNWVHSATIYGAHDGSPQNPAGPLSVAAGQTTFVAFGNYCTIPSNGRTLGFWSNKNGQRYVAADDLALLAALNLRNKNGSNFDPGNYAALRAWLLNGDAVNMAYMLSVQLAAMELNVYNGFVDGGGYYVPAGMTINQLMAAANASLGLYPITTSSNDIFGQRSNQETLKNWLDELNNGAGVLSPTPCAYTFP
ncbi:hypothetical protein [Luteimonas vadosa]|uniref:SD-repeat containing protein B domain-containing protein n=1 Tax=Luteimonas vadosa TaxID=1165507 RepID=A0ABP9DWB0_9GAMM